MTERRLTYRITTTAGTTFVTSPNDTYLGKSVELYGEWSHGEIIFLAQVLQPDSNVVEVGSNIGAHTVFFGRDLCPNGRVYAFEPRRLMFQLLCANLAVNSITNVHAFQQALGAAPGVVHEGPMPQDAANLGSYPIGTLPGDGETYPVAPLDQWLDSMPPITLIKADVEGHERAVLQGASRLIARDRPLLYLENDRAEQSESLVRHVRALDYDLWWHIVPAFRPDNPAGTTVNIFGALHSFNMFCAPRERGITVKDCPPVDDANHPFHGS